LVLRSARLMAWCSITFVDDEVKDGLLSYQAQCERCDGVGCGSLAPSPAPVKPDMSVLGHVRSMISRICADKVKKSDLVNTLVLAFSDDGVSESTIVSIIDELLREGELFEPERGFVKRVGVSKIE